MKLMSHNSWSFLTPKTFFGKLIKFTAKCQEVNIQTQYEKYDVRMFDLRVKLDSNGKLTLLHGLVKYKTSLQQLEKDLKFLNEKGDVVVRVLLDIRFEPDDTKEQREWFINYCSQLENLYQNIKFCGGNPTYCGIAYYKFKYPLPSIEDGYASEATKTKLDDLWPKRFAKKNNKKFLSRETSKEYLALDFVNIR